MSSRIRLPGQRRLVRAERSQWDRQLVILVTGTISLFYIIYRGLFTLNLGTPYAAFASLLLYIAEVYGFTVVMLFYLQVWDTREPPEQPILPDRTVDVFVPTYNEDPDLLRTTLQACKRLTYPHKTYLCDDGGTEARCNDPQKGPSSRERQAKLRAICDELGATYVTRPDNRHAKAGNLNHAFDRTDGEFIIIFDADHVPEPHFIDRLIGYFADEKLAWVQTPHAFYNFESFQSVFDHDKNLYWEDGELFYQVIQPGRNRWNAAIFAGSAAMFRRTALAEVGYIATETITEDMHTGLRMQMRGWKSLGISERLIAGQAAPDVTTFHTQRLRWGEGNLSIMAHDNPLTAKGLTLGQRLCYFGSMIHWAGGLFKLALYATPLLMLFTGTPPVNQFTWFLFGLTLVYVFGSIFGFKYVSNGHGSFWRSELFTMVGFWTQAQGVIKALFMRNLSVFVVTSKRGRQSKSIWPFIRPHVYFIAVSVVALFWGWSRVLFGLSDDVYKPILASAWAVFHMSLAAVAIRRSLWPEDRRYSYRHFVHLPAEYTPRDGDTTLAVTTDVSEVGVGLIAYQPLAIGAPVSFRVFGTAETFEATGTVVRCEPLGKPGLDTGGYRIGFKLENLPPKQFDTLNRIAMHYAVPRLYERYGQRRTPWVVRTFRRLAARSRRRSRREPYRLPFALQAGGRDFTHGCTEDVSREGMVAVFPAPLPHLAEFGFALMTPAGPVSGTVRAARSEPNYYAAREYYRVALEFTHFHDQGRVILNDLLGPLKKPHEPALVPTKEKTPVPVVRPVALGLAACVPLLITTALLFRWVESDNFFLRDVATGSGALSPEAIARVEQIYARTLQQYQPDTDRLVLMVAALGRSGKDMEADRVLQRLAARDTKNIDLQIANANAFLHQKEYAKAKAEYEKLLALSRAGRLPPDRQRELTLALARSSSQAGELDKAVKLFRGLIRESPRDQNLRYELAGLLLNARRFDEATAAYDGITPDRKGRLLLATVASLANKPDAADDQIALLLRDDPNDAEAQLLKADILNQRNSVTQAELIYQRLRKLNPGDPAVRSRLGFIALAGRNYDQALAVFQQLVEEGVAKPADVRGFVDAASAVARLPESTKPIALAVADKAFAEWADDPVYLGRLGWVLQRLQEPERGLQLVELAVKADGTNPELNRQYIGLLVAAKRWEAALVRLEKADRTPEMRVSLAGVYFELKRFADAERELQSALKEKPNDWPARELLAATLGMQGRSREALAQWQELARDKPGDPNLPIRIAQALLDCREYADALGRFQAILQTNFEQPELWEGAINAASGLRTVPGNLMPIVRRIAERGRQGQIAKAEYLSRLAYVLLENNDRAGVPALLDRAVALKSDDPDVRVELSGVLAQAGRFRDALAQLEGVPLDKQDPFRLIALHSALREWDKAERICWNLLQSDPDDKRANRWLADVTSWKGDYSRSLDLFSKLLREHPDDPDLMARQADVLLWSGDASAALPKYRQLLDKSFEQPKLWEGYLAAAADGLPRKRTSLEESFEQPKLWESFLAAAAEARSPSPADVAMVNRIYQRTQGSDAAAARLMSDPIVLARLGGALERIGRTADAQPLIMRAIELAPADLSQRKELAKVLAGIRRFAEALQLYEPLPLDREDRYNLVGIYAAIEDFARARGKCDELLRADPDDKKATRLLADVLSWEGEHARAIRLFDELCQHDPLNLEYKIRRAEVTLWSGDAPAALARFQAIPETVLERDSVRRAYVDSAAAIDRGSPVQPDPNRLRVLVERALTAKEDTSIDPVYLARLGLASSRFGDRDAAAKLLDRAVSVMPRDPIAKLELGGALQAAGRPADALKLFDGLVLEGKHRFRKAEAFAAMQQFDLARQEAERLFRADPTDTKAKRILADVLSYQGAHAEALKLFDELIADFPEDVTLKVRRAETVLWSGDAAGALERLTALPESAFEKANVRRAFVDASAGLDPRGGIKPDAAKLRSLAGPALIAGNELSNDAVYLARLGLALHRCGEQAIANRVLDRAIDLNPRDPAVRLEVGGSLVAAGRFAEAGQFYHGIKLEGKDRFRLIDLHTARGDFAAALREARALVLRDTRDFGARRRLADVLSYKGDHAEALKLYAELRREQPSDIDLTTRNAEALAAAGQFAEAVALFQSLGPTAIDRPAVRFGWIDAAAGAGDGIAPKLDPAWLRAMRDRAALAGDPLRGDVVRLARLGLILAWSGDRDGAAAILKPALEQKPLSVEMRLKLGGALVAAGLHEEALKLYTGLELAGEHRFRLLEAYAAKPDWPAAVAEARRLVKADPNDTAALRWLADVLSWKGDHAEALELFTRLNADHPHDPGLAVRIAEVQLWSGDGAKALPTFRTALERSFDQPKVWESYLEALAVAKTPDPADARLAGRLLEKARSNDPSAERLRSDPVTLVRFAAALEKVGRGDDATTLYARANERVPADGRKRLAEALAGVKKFREALDLFATVELEGTDWVRVAALHSALGEFDRAAARCRERLREQPSDRAAVRLLADVLSYRGEFAESLQLFDGLIASAPDDVGLQVRRAEVTLWSGDAAAALARMQKLPESEFDRPAVARAFADAAAGVGSDDAVSIDRVRGRRVVERALAGVDESLQAPLARARAGVVAYRIGDTASANQLLDAAIAAAPRDAQTRLELGGLLQSAGRPADALRLYDGLVLDGRDRFRRADAYTALNQFDRAKDEVRRLLAINPADAEARRLLADVLSYNREFAAALALFEELRKEQPDDPRLQMRVAEVTLWSGDAAGALKLLAQLPQEAYRKPSVRRAFADAAAAVDPGTGGSAPALIWRPMAEAALNGTDPLAADALYLARLGLGVLRAGDEPVARQLMDRAAALAPNDPAIRLELGGAFAAAKRFAEASRFYDGIPLEGEHRFRLVDLHAARNDWPSALREVRDRIRRDPNDTEARRREADLLAYQGNHAEALRAIDQLIAAEPNHLDLQFRRAEFTLWAGRPAEAVELLQALPDDSIDQPAVRRCWIDAAAGAGQKRVVHLNRNWLRSAGERVRVAGDPFRDDGTRLARLGLVLAWANETELSELALRRAVELNPTAPEQRMQLGGALVAAGLKDEALRLYRGLTFTGENRFRLVELYSAFRDWDAALTEARRIAANDPADDTARRWIADLLSWRGGFAESIRLFRELLTRKPGDIELQIRLTEVMLWSGDYRSALPGITQLPEAEVLARPTLMRGFIDATSEQSAPLTEEQTVRARAIARRTIDAAPEDDLRSSVEYLSRLAWILLKLTDRADADRLLDIALSLKPSDPKVSKELAGVLAAAKRVPEAAQLVEGLTFDAGDRFQLISILSAKRDFVKAEAEARKMLAEAVTPDQVFRANRWLADVLSWKGDFDLAIELFQALGKQRPDDPAIPMRIAEVTLWKRDYEKALVLFEGELRKHPRQPQLGFGFVSAAAAVIERLPLSPAQVELLDRIESSAENNAIQSPAFWARLAWVRYKLNSGEHAVRLLRKATDLKSSDPDEIRELASVFSAMKQFKEAVDLLAQLHVRPEDRFRMAELFAAAEMFDRSKEQLRLMLRDKPDDLDARRLLADVLSWNKDFQESQEQFDTLLKAKPGDFDLLRRKAEVYLWMREPNRALDLFTELSAKRPTDAAVRRGFADAAAAATGLSSNALAIAVRLGREAIDSPVEDETLYSARLCLALHRADQTELSAALAKKLMTAPAPTPEARRELAGILAAVGQGKRAVELYRSLSLRPDEKLPLVDLLVSDQQHQEAEREARELMKSMPDSTEARKKLALALTAGAKHAEALAEYRALKKQEPNNLELDVHLACSQLWSGDADGALPQFVALLGRTNDSRVVNGYLDALSQVEKFNAAEHRVRLAEMWRKTDRTKLSEAKLRQWAWLFRRLDNLEMAVWLQGELLRKSPDNDAVRLEYAQTLDAMGRNAEAARHYDYLLRKQQPRRSSATNGPSRP